MPKRESKKESSPKGEKARFMTPLNISERTGLHFTTIYRRSKNVGTEMDVYVKSEGEFHKVPDTKIKVVDTQLMDEAYRKKKA